MYSSLSAAIHPLSLVFSSPPFIFIFTLISHQGVETTSWRLRDQMQIPFLSQCSLGPGLVFKILPGMGGHDRRDLHLAIDSCHYPQLCLETYQK